MIFTAKDSSWPWEEGGAKDGWQAANSQGQTEGEVTRQLVQTTPNASLYTQGPLASTTEEENQEIHEVGLTLWQEQCCEC